LEKGAGVVDSTSDEGQLVMNLCYLLSTVKVLECFAPYCTEAGFRNGFDILTKEIPKQPTLANTNHSSKPKLKLKNAEHPVVKIECMKHEVGRGPSC
jgi:hypothetical protein